MLRLVDILIQLPSNKICIVIWRKGQVVRSHSQVILVNFWRADAFFSTCRLSHITDLNKRASASSTISAAVGASLGRYHDRLNRHQAGAAYSRVAIVVARVTSVRNLISTSANLPLIFHY